MNILGISAFYHDSAACLIQDGIIIAAAQEERFSRKKHDDRLPQKAIDYCLLEGKIGMKDVDLVVFYEKPFLKFERLLETYVSFAPIGITSFLKAMPIWLKRKLWMKEYMATELDYHGKFIFPEHHESHAASAFLPSPFENAAILTLDGVGEFATASYGVGKGNEVTLLAELEFPHSLGMLYSAFTYYTGFKVNSGEYKVMGLAPYGQPIYEDLIMKELVDLKEDGSFRLNMDYFNYATGLTMTNGRFNELFGGLPRKPESPLTQREMDLACSVQAVTEKIIIKIAKHVRKETGQKYLVLAGGVALNCVANGKLLRSGIFDDIWIQPAAGDAGGALGAAMLGWYGYLGNIRVVDGVRDSMRGTYLGPNYSDSQIEEYLKAHSISYEYLDGDKLPRRIADLLQEEKVIGWFEGRMEFGPRALGARSIIGDARSVKMQSIMNLKIKFRESFRPFAPSILAEKVSEYFDIDRSSPYMLLVANVNKKHKRLMTNDEERLFGIDKLNIVRSDIPAVTHVDYSARVETVHRETNPLYHKMISEFETKTGCPVIINTSFNVRGEPIVCTPEDAYRCFMRTDMDYLVMGRYLIDKTKQRNVEKDSDWRKEFQLD